jgi:hypothetical protein
MAARARRVSERVLVNYLPAMPVIWFEKKWRAYSDSTNRLPKIGQGFLNWLRRVLPEKRLQLPPEVAAENFAERNTFRPGFVLSPVPTSTGLPGFAGPTRPEFRGANLEQTPKTPKPLCAARPK